MNLRRIKFNRDELFQKGAIFAITLFISSIILLSAIFITRTVYAQNNVQRIKLAMSLEIEEGDTLWSIASQYISDEYDTITDYITEIKESNGLASDTINTGNYLIIPYYADASY
jgi:hypothetical protein